VSSRNRRKADRVEVGIPVQLCTKRGNVAAEVRDLSRTGLRLRLPAEALGSAGWGDPARAARAVGEMLTPSFSLDLHYEELGPLLHRDAFPTRVGLPSDDPTAIEVCCEFRDVIEEHEEGFLQLEQPLPPMKDSVEEWADVEGGSEIGLGKITFHPASDANSVLLGEKMEATIAPPPVLRRPRQRYRALVNGLKHNAPPSIFAHTDLITGVGVRVRLSRNEAEMDDVMTLSAASALMTLIHRFGETLELRLIDKNRVDDVYCGPGRFSGVELPPDEPDEMLVTIAFGRQPTLSEMRDLDLVDRAA